MVEPTPVADVMMSAETLVQLNLTPGNAEPTTRSPVIDP
jgi:hypothetical protein